MSDIIDNEEIDKDIVDPKTLKDLFTRKYKLLTETAVSLKKSYINKLAGTKSLKFAVSQSNNTIEVYALSNTSLIKVCRLSGHEKSLNEIVFDSDDHLLYSCGEDGLVKLWDTRASGSCVQEYKDEEETLIKPFLCMDISYNNRIICAGSEIVKDDAYLVFWDQRVLKPLGGYWNSHTDDITQVKFHKEKTEIVASGSVDGLINIFNIMEQSEEDALSYSLNTESSVEKLNWLNNNDIGCISQCNNFQLWDAENGNLRKYFSRDKVSRCIKRSKGDDCYLVDSFTSCDDSIVLLAGSYGGNGDVLRSVVVTDKKMLSSTMFMDNKQIVRSCCYNKDMDLLVTTGESGIISVWSGKNVLENGSVQKNLAKSLNKMHVGRHKPY